MSLFVGQVLDDGDMEGKLWRSDGRLNLRLIDRGRDRCTSDTQPVGCGCSPLLC
jgi:hypothetical protein